MNRKVAVILILAALFLTTGAILATPGEDSDCARITKILNWQSPCGKEGGDEGIFLRSIIGKESN